MGRAHEATPLRLADMLHHISGLPVYFDLKNVPMRNRTYWVSEDYPAEFGCRRPQFPLRSASALAAMRLADAVPKFRM